MSVSRRALLGIALVGLVRKSGPRLRGGFVFDSADRGHELRDGRFIRRAARSERTGIVIIGAGIAGLSAAWRLAKRGYRDFVVLELEDQAGGNARSGQNEITPFPWAAHYVPVPGREVTLVRKLFEDLGLLNDGAWDERALCFEPQERLFLHGRWQEGLEPQIGPTRRDRDQIARFEDRMTAYRATGAFTVPSGAGLAREAGRDLAARLDRLSMAGWLEREGFDSPYLRWMVDYACRDDYGARPGDVSAWAGVHYHAARNPDERGPLTWPDGNGWIAKRLLERVGDRVRTASAARRIARHGERWVVSTTHADWQADAVIYAAPAFIAPYLFDAAPAVDDFAYSPWLTANLTLDRWPRERGVGPAWDNVLFDSPGLGYIVATHQSLRTHIPRTVWTYYRALADGDPRANRSWLLAQPWETLARLVLDDLRRAHADIDDCVSRIDILRLGHAMIRPGVGFLASPGRQALRAGQVGLYFAHSDVSGLSLFEEAHAGGVEAAELALGRVGGRPARQGSAFGFPGN